MTSLKFDDVTNLGSVVKRLNCLPIQSPVANIRKMLLMEDGSFLYELRAYHIHVKVGEKVLFSPVAC